MPIKRVLKLSKYQLFTAILFPLMLGVENAAQAEKLNAGVVMDKMTSEQRVSYVSGVIEGLAYARFVRDKPSEKGMKCIYDWFYKDNAELWKTKLFPMFDRHRDKPVGVILYVLAKKECGE